MNDAVSAQCGAVSGRLNGVVILSPRQAFAASLRQRLARPLQEARHSLAARIRLAAIGMIALLVILGLIVGAAMSLLAARSERARILNEASLASAELTASIADSRYYASRFAVTGDQSEMAHAHETLARTRDRLEQTRQRSVDTESQAVEAMEWLSYQVEGFESELGALDSSVRAYGPSESGNSLARAIDVSGEQLAEQARAVEKRLAGASSSTASDLSSLGWSLAAAVLALISVGVAITVVGARFITRTTSHSIREITGTMTALASGDRGVSLPGTSRQDEIGEMARALAVFRQGAQELARLQEEAAITARAELARQEAEQERKDAEQQRKGALMQEVAARFEMTVGEIVSSVASASQQLEITASTMAAAASQSAQVTGEVTHSMQSSTAGMTAAASAGDQFAASIGEISQQASSSAIRAQEARRVAKDADAAIAALANSASEIEQIVGMIDGIAQRTSLLALNASIEAARSGEAGRGFAVVAGEVKALARQTSNATGNVAERIQAIQTATDESVAALRQIADQVHLLEASAVAIAESVDEQTMASRELARNLSMAATGADEVGSSMDQVSDTAQSTGAAATQVLEAASDLHRQADVLRGQVDEFLGYIRRA